MFLEKYLSKENFETLLENYDERYLNSLDEKNFLEVYKVFKKYDFYFINDIILKYLDLFEEDSKDIEKRILIIKENLGDYFVFKIGKNLEFLELLKTKK